MKGGALDARSRLTPLLGTAMAGVAAGCLLLFAVFARQAILNTNPGLGVLPDAPSTAIRQAITLLSPLQTARPEPPEEIAPATPTVAPAPATTSPDIDVVVPPTDNFTRPSADEGDAGRGVGNLPLGERLPAGIGRQDSGEWWLDDPRGHHRGGRGHADHGKGRGHEKKAKAQHKKSMAKSKSWPSRSDHPGRGRGTSGTPSAAEKSRPAPAGHGHGRKPHQEPERKPQVQGKQHGHGPDHGHGQGKGKGHGKGAPPRGRGRS